MTAPKERKWYPCERRNRPAGVRYVRLSEQPFMYSLQAMDWLIANGYVSWDCDKLEWRGYGERYFVVTAEQCIFDNMKERM